MQNPFSDKENLGSWFDWPLEVQHLGENERNKWEEVSGHDTMCKTLPSLLNAKLTQKVLFLQWSRLTLKSLLDSHKRCGVLMLNPESQFMKVPKLLMNEFDFNHRLESCVYFVYFKINSPQKCYLFQGSWIKWHWSTQSGFPQWKSNCPFFGRPPRGVLPGSSCPRCHTHSLWIGTDLWKSHIAFRNICILN